MTEVIRLYLLHGLRPSGPGMYLPRQLYQIIYALINALLLRGVIFIVLHIEQERPIGLISGSRHGAGAKLDAVLAALDIRVLILSFSLRITGIFIRSAYINAELVETIGYG